MPAFKYWFQDRDGQIHKRTSAAGRVYTHAVVVKWKGRAPDPTSDDFRFQKGWAAYKPNAQYASRKDLADKVASGYAGRERIEWVDVYPVQTGNPPKAAPVKAEREVVTYQTKY